MPLHPPPIAWHSHGRVPPARQAMALRPLADCIAQACAHRDGHPALVGLDETVSRAELRDRAWRIAAHVRRHVPAGQRVATLLPHSPSGIAALLGCMLSGRLCVVLNTADPPDRLRFILDDAAPAAVLLHSSSPPVTLPPGATPLLLADALAAPADLPPAPHDPDAPCTLHYTSGSSGRAKGVVLSSFALLTRAVMGIERQHLVATDRLLVATGIADASAVSTVLAALVAGATSLVVSVGQQGTGALLRLAAREGATLLAATTALLRVLARLPSATQAVARLRLLRLGGAGMAAEDAVLWRPLLPPGCVISHAYGSTEALLISEWTVPADVQGTVAMGHILPGLEWALLDPAGQPVPDGAVGEMVLRGRQLALGEWQGGQLVPGRMPPDPAEPLMRIFHTGDLLRRDADGVLHFAGRADRQLKVNGVRVEPGEIEAALREDPAVTDAAVVPAPDGTLHGFVAAPLDDATLHPRLAARMRAALPTALRPRRITILPALPLLPSGKHDLQALARRAAEGG